MDSHGIVLHDANHEPAAVIPDNGLVTSHHAGNDGPSTPAAATGADGQLPSHLIVPSEVDPDDGTGQHFGDDLLPPDSPAGWTVTPELDAVLGLHGVVLHADNQGSLAVNLDKGLEITPAAGSDGPAGHEPVSGDAPQ